MINKSVRRQVLLPLLLTFTVLLTTFVTTSYHIRSEELDRKISHMYQRFQDIFTSLTESRINYMQSIAEIISEQKRFQTAMLTGDRESLLKESRYLFKSVYSHLQITHLYFHDTKGNMVLRVYQPENLSNSSHKHIMQKAMTEQRTVSGLEIGKNGTFTLRVIHPWIINGKNAGYIEIGHEIDAILSELKKIANIEFMVVLNKQFLERSTWEAGMKMLGRTPDWELMPDRVLVENSLNAPNSKALEYISASPDSEHKSNIVKTDGLISRVSAFPLKDVADREIGCFILVKNITEATISARTYIIKVTFFSMSLCAALFAFAFHVLGRTDRELKDSAEKLRKELQYKEATARNLEAEVQVRMKAEDDLRRLNENLEQHVHDRTSELHTANLELEQGRKALEEAYKDLQKQHETILKQDKMACLGQLAAGIAHDINNPIGFIHGNLEVLDKYWKRTLSLIEQCEEADEKIKAVSDELKIGRVKTEIPVIMSECREGIERIRRIVLNLKGFSSLDEDIGLADINTCIESTISMVLNEFRHKTEIRRDYGDIPLLMCNQQQINQVIMNLLINASQAIDSRGEVSVKTWQDGKNIFIRVHDNGCGIPEKDLSSIFEPFFTTKKTGTGLGLAIVCEIVKNHGGEISVESSPGDTQITVTLPITEGKSDEA